MEILFANQGSCPTDELNIVSSVKSETSDQKYFVAAKLETLSGLWAGLLTRTGVLENWGRSQKYLLRLLGIWSIFFGGQFVKEETVGPLTGKLEVDQR